MTQFELEQYVNAFVMSCFIVLLAWCVQVVELPSHPYFVGAQFHPEFKSRPGKPSALFLGKFWVIVR